MAIQDSLSGLRGQGMLVAVPNPSPADTATIESAIHQALEEADRQHVLGAAVTPFVLARVEQLTLGKSLDANVALVKNNANVAASIAVQYASLAPKKTSISKGLAPNVSPTVGESISSHCRPSEAAGAAPPSTECDSSLSHAHLLDKSATGTDTPSPPLANRPQVLVIGGAVVDQVMVPSPAAGLVMHTSNPGSISINYGGVGRNVAEAIARLGKCGVSLVSAVGADAHGTDLLQHASDAGIDVSSVLKGSQGDRTAMYAAVHDQAGDLVVAIADMAIFSKLLSPQAVQAVQLQIQRSQMVVTDGNLTPECFAAVADCCEANGVPLFFEPTSVHKCVMPILANSLHKVRFFWRIELLVYIQSYIYNNIHL